MIARCDVVRIPETFSEIDMFSTVMNWTAALAMTAHALFGCCWHHSHAQGSAVAGSHHCHAACEQTPPTARHCHRGCSHQVKHSHHADAAVENAPTVPCDSKHAPHPHEPCDHDPCVFMTAAKVICQVHLQQAMFDTSAAADLTGQGVCGGAMLLISDSRSEQRLRCHAANSVWQV